MSNEYEVVKAETREEALSKSKWKVGDTAVVSSVNAVANTDGTWTVLPSFSKPERESDA